MVGAHKNTWNAIYNLCSTSNVWLLHHILCNFSHTSAPLPPSRVLVMPDWPSTLRLKVVPTSEATFYVKWPLKQVVILVTVSAEAFSNILFLSALKVPISLKILPVSLEIPQNVLLILEVVPKLLYFLYWNPNFVYINDLG